MGYKSDSYITTLYHRAHDSIVSHIKDNHTRNMNNWGFSCSGDTKLGLPPIKNLLRKKKVNHYCYLTTVRVQYRVHDRTLADMKIDTHTTRITCVAFALLVQN